MQPEPSATVHWDITIMPRGFNGNRYAVHFIDMCAHFNMVYCCCSKAYTQRVIPRWAAWCENQHGTCLKEILTDGETWIDKAIKDDIARPRNQFFSNPIL
ncbi:hypothetical protein K470DRAFT_260400 [Piedraia hortae CBS 480.64]|uniref:Integrase catalytic domain-containing protein n=1 Tax=Piedraia hortae CBS 480.64 TaxID=1314780 RepID=A0A6A7BSZ8_9PEZI|nr:hypothetical protein K470DRAFT_260400 [Piedraia hortae CBS 480.64]